MHTYVARQILFQNVDRHVYIKAVCFNLADVFVIPLLVVPTESVLRVFFCSVLEILIEIRIEVELNIYKIIPNMISEVLLAFQNWQYSRNTVVPNLVVNIQ